MLHVCLSVSLFICLRARRPCSAPQIDVSLRYVTESFSVYTQSVTYCFSRSLSLFTKLRCAIVDMRDH